MTTTTDDGFHEIQLNGKQLVFLFMAVTVVSVVIFLCGVLVGRGVAAEAAQAEPLAAAGLQAEAPAPDTAPAAVLSEGGSPATANEDLSYPDRLSGPPLAGDRPQDVTESVPQTDEPPVPAPAPTPVAPPTAAAPESGGAGYAIQVAALGERLQADAVAHGLTRKGYPAFVLAPMPGAPAVFRVRVGTYPDRRAAESVAARLEKEEQFKPWIVR